MTVEKQNQIAAMPLQAKIELVELMIDDILQRNPQMVGTSLENMVNVREIVQDEDVNKNII